MPTIYLLAKFYKEYDYAREFYERGRLFFQPISYFAELENVSDCGRLDEREALIGCFQPSLVSLEIGNHVIPNDDIVGRIFVQEKNGPSIFCLYAIHSGAFCFISDTDLGELKQSLKISNRILKFGQHAVLITNVKEFLVRVDRATQERFSGASRGLVTYFDPEVCSGILRPPFFQKRNSYSYQSEYRIAIESGAEIDGGTILEIGSIEDISLFISTEALQNLIRDIEIKLPDSTLPSSD